MARTPKKKSAGRALTKTGKRFPSSTGKVKGVVVDQSTWRKKLQTSRLKFDDVQKQVYLKTLAEDGRKGNAFRAAGVAQSTVAKHRANDRDFAEAESEAVGVYRDKVVGVVQTIVLDGEVHERFDGRTGNLVEKYTKREASIVMMEAKFVEPGYRENQQPQPGVLIGGVLIAPASMTPAEWVRRAEERNKTAICPLPDDEADLLELTPDSKGVYR